MHFSVRVSDYQKNTMLNICDADLVGKNLSNDKFNLCLSKSYYGERLVEKVEAENLLKGSSIINMAGKKIISLSVSLGVGSEKGVKEIDGVPFLIVFKM